MRSMLPAALAALSLFSLAPAAAVAATPAPSPAPPVAQAPPKPPARTLIVGTKDAPPFAIKGADGEWSGISIELWREIASALGYRYEFRETTLDGLLHGVTDGSLDLAVAALTITAEREGEVDFTHPFYVAGLGIAVPANAQADWIGVVRKFISPGFLKVVFGLVGLLAIVGSCVWYFERRSNPEQFGGGFARGVGASIWWSAVTMTTVGYGDKAPRTLGGRVVGLVWMFAGVIIISSFTAAITSSLTLGQLQGPVQEPADLARARVGAVDSSTTAEYLTGRRIAFTRYGDPVSALGALEAGALDAVVYDVPILRYDVHANFNGKLRVLPGTFQRQYYGIALPAGSPLRKEINRALLSIVEAPGWQDVLARYLGWQSGG